jgi:hypothetical protein
MIQQQNRAKSNLTLSLLQMGANRDHPYHFSTLPNLTLKTAAPKGLTTTPATIPVPLGREFGVLEVSRGSIETAKISD